MAVGAGVRLEFGGADPEVVVEFLGRVLRIVVAELVVVGLPGASDDDPAELAGADVIERGDELAGAALPGADLGDPLVLLGGGGHRLGFADVVTDRLFEIHVLAGLAGQDRRQGVPVVGRGDDDGVDVIAVEDLAEVLDDFRTLALLLFDVVGRLTGVAGVDVADHRDRDLLINERIHVRATHPAASDQGDHGGVEGGPGGDLGTRVPRASDREQAVTGRRAGGGGAQKGSSGRFLGHLGVSSESEWFGGRLSGEDDHAPSRLIISPELQRGEQFAATPVPSSG